MENIWSLTERQKQAQEFIEMANKLRQDKQFDGSEDVVAARLALRHGNLKLAEQVAENLMARGDWSAAADCWRELLLPGARVQPHVGQMTKLLRSLRRAERLDEAASLVADYQEVFGQDSGFLQEMALVNAARSDWENAARAWRAIAAISAGFFQASQYIQWSITERKLGKFDEAARILVTGLAKFPGDVTLKNEVDLVEFERLIEVGEVRRYDVPLTVASNGSEPAIDIAGLCEFFWNLEKKHSLIAWQVNGVFPWPLVRMQIYYRIAQLVGLFSPPHPAQEQVPKTSSNAKDALLADWKLQEDAYQAWRRRGEKGWSPQGLGKWLFHRSEAATGMVKYRHALLTDTRKVDGVEPYSSALRAELNGDALLLDRPSNGIITDCALNLGDVQDLFISRFGRPEHSRFPIEDQLLCHHLRGEFLNNLGVDPGNLALMCQNRIRTFIPLQHGARILFTVNHINTLFITYAYGARNQAMIAGARDSGASVVELQHGFISPLHLGYSWPDNPDVPYTPDQLWGFGDFWAETTPLAARTRWRTIGAPYVRKRAEAHTAARDPKLVVFTSQGVIGPRLFEIALKTAERRSDYSIIFRLHPNEALEPYEAAMAGRAAPSNFELSHRAPNIFALLSRTAIQVGSFSTTLFEGMSLGVRTVVMDLPGAEYMRPAIERGDALFVRDVDELVERLDQAPLASDPQFYYADPVKKLL